MSQKSPATPSLLRGSDVPPSTEEPSAPAAPATPAGPCGITKFNFAAVDVPELVTDAVVPVETDAIETVAEPLTPSLPSAPAGPAGPAAPIMLTYFDDHEELPLGPKSFPVRVFIQKSPFVPSAEVGSEVPLKTEEPSAPAEPAGPATPATVVLQTTERTPSTSTLSESMLCPTGQLNAP